MYDDQVKESARRYLKQITDLSYSLVEALDATYRKQFGKSGNFGLLRDAILAMSAIALASIDNPSASDDDLLTITKGRLNDSHRMGMIGEMKIG